MSIQSTHQKLKAFLGTWGCQTGLLDPDSLIETARLAFDVPGRSIGDVTYAIARLGAAERAARVKSAIRKYWPTPSALWPANAPVRKKLAQEET